MKRVTMEIQIRINLVQRQSISDYNPSTQSKSSPIDRKTDKKTTKSPPHRLMNDTNKCRTLTLLPRLCRDRRIIPRSKLLTVHRCVVHRKVMIEINQIIP